MTLSDILYSVAVAVLPIIISLLGGRYRNVFNFKTSPAASTNGNGHKNGNGNGNGYGLELAKSQTLGQEAILGSVDKLEKLIELRFQQQDTKIEHLRMDYEGYALKLTESANGYTDQRMTTLQKAFDELRQSIIGQS